MRLAYKLACHLKLPRKALFRLDQNCSSNSRYSRHGSRPKELFASTTFGLLQPLRPCRVPRQIACESFGRPAPDILEDICVSGYSRDTERFAAWQATANA